MNTSQKVFVKSYQNESMQAIQIIPKIKHTALGRGKSIMLLYGHCFKSFQCQNRKEYKHNTPAASLL